MQKFHILKVYLSLTWIRNQWQKDTNNVNNFPKAQPAMYQINKLPKYLFTDILNFLTGKWNYNFSRAEIKKIVPPPRILTSKISKPAISSTPMKCCLFCLVSRVSLHFLTKYLNRRSNIPLDMAPSEYVT